MLQTKGGKMAVNKNLVIVGVLVLVLVISLVQAYQLSNIKSNVEDLGTGGTTLKVASSPSTTSTSTTSSSGGGIPTNIQDLEGMVGGC